MNLKKKFSLIFSVVMIAIILISSGFMMREVKQLEKTLVADKTRAQVSFIGEYVDNQVGGMWQVINKKLYKGSTKFYGNDTISKALAKKTESKVAFVHDGKVISASDESIKSEIDYAMAKEAMESGELKIHDSNARVHAYQPIKKGNDVIAINYVSVDKADIQAKTLSMLQKIIALGIVLLIAGIAVISKLVEKMVSPIIQVKNELEDIAQGQGDLTRRINLSAEGEIKDLVVAFNQFMDNLNILIKEVNDSANELYTSGEEILSTVHNSNELVDGIYQKSNIIRDMSSENMGHIGRTEASIEEITKSVESSVSDIENIAMKTFILTEEAKTGKDNIEEINAEILNISELVKNTVESLNELSGLSTEIVEIVDVIKNICDETNLLSLNANIEAARAGEHGRGFAIVAGEVRKLSVETSASAENISVIIQKFVDKLKSSVREAKGVEVIVQNSSQKSVDVKDSIVKITDSIDDVSQSVTAIAGMIEEQSAASQEVNASTKYFVESIETTDENIMDIGQSIEKQKYEFENLNSLANNLSKVSENLESLVSKFKL